MNYERVAMKKNDTDRETDKKRMRYERKGMRYVYKGMNTNEKRCDTDLGRTCYDQSELDTY